MRKTVTRAASLALAMCMGTSMVACGGGGHEGECEIKAVIAGHGVDWLHEAVEVFNETFKDEGYKVVVTLTDTDIGMSEVQTPKRNTTDLYFGYTTSIKSFIDKSRLILGADGGLLLEDVSDVLDSKAVGKDGKEQGGAISERIEEFDIQLNRYNGNTVTGADGVYGIPWYGGSAGVYVNKKVLEEKGYTLDAFLTSDSIIEVSEALAPPGDKRLDRNEFFPVAWTGSSAGYWSYWVQTMLAQYMGEEEFDDLYNFIPEGGEEELIESGWTVYEERGIFETLKVAETLMNRDWAMPGTVSIDMIGAQVRLMEGQALFMVSGDWIYKEMERDYSEYLEDVVSVKTPVLSALGVKLGLCGTTHPEPSCYAEPFVEDYSCDACEAKLRAVIKAVDAKDKTKNAEIATELGVTEEQVATIRERRGYYENTGGFSAMIPSYSDQKDVAKLFLRFMCSDDGIDIYREYALGNFKARYINEPDMSDWGEAQVAMYDKMYHEDATPIYTKTDNIIRLTNGPLIYSAGGNVKGAFLNLSYSRIATKNHLYTAKYTFLDNLNRVKGNWQDWLMNVGLVG